MDQSKYRSEVIEKFIACEMMINAIISQHYFKKIHKDFYFIVLYDEYFNFGLRRRILEKLVKDLDKKMIQKLNRLNTIRNYFAHCDIKYIDDPENTTYENNGIILDPRNPENMLVDFESLYKEFIEKEEEVMPYLTKIFEKMGGKIMDPD